MATFNLVENYRYIFTVVLHATLSPIDMQCTIARASEGAY